MPSRVGLLTLPLHKNYGGILQAAALYKYLTSCGVEVVLLERAQPKTWLRRAATAISWALPKVHGVVEGNGAISIAVASVLTRNKRISRKTDALRRLLSNQRFIEEFLPTRSGLLRNSNEMRRAIGRFNLDAVIVGSDQVWRPDYMPDGAVRDFFLGFAEGTPVRLISYAASFGHGQWHYRGYTSEVADLLSRFTAVSVRESSGVEICRDVFGRSGVVHAADPTLLVDPGFYNEVAVPPTTKSGKVIFAYILDQNVGARSIVGEVAASLTEAYSVRSVDLGEESSLLSIGGWVRSIMDADFVITDSFHGMVFSIIFRKNFLAIVNQKRGADRFTSLANILGLEERLIDTKSMTRVGELAVRPIDHDAVALRLQAHREKSRNFIRDAVGMMEP